MVNQEFKKALEASREIDLTVTGRTSGPRISLPVWFASDRDKLYLVPVTGSGSGWFKNVLKPPTNRLAAAGVQLDANDSPDAELHAISDEGLVRPGQGQRKVAHGLDHLGPAPI
jgi:hypothetical protein